MKSLQIMLMSIWAILLFTNLNADNTPQVGSDRNGGIFLYRESVEMYWNDWVSCPLMDKKDLPSNGQVELTIRGEGKTANFAGVLSLNCENGKNFWLTASEKEPEDFIPLDVILNIKSIFCKEDIAKSFTPSQAISSEPLICTTPALINMVTKQYEDHVLDLLLSTRFGMKTTYADFQNIMNNAETSKGKKELQAVLNKTVDAYKKLSISIQLIRTINRDESSGMVECVGTLDFGNGKTAEAGYKGQYTDNGEIYMVYKPLF